jgi:hypothetical protein
MTTQEVLDKFASLPKAQTIGKGNDSFVFIEGTRPDRILLVAHADTVWNEPVDPIYAEGYYFSGKKDIGIGADDRSGCAMLWELRNSGHSILVPNAEEKGCLGSRFLMNQKGWPEIIENHQFAIEMDRMDANDLAFYEIGSSKFKDWCEAHFKGYKRTHGMWTDICVLCKKICGMNISIGYYGQHGSCEKQSESEWLRTLHYMKELVALKEIPKFIQDPKPVYNNSYYGHSYTGGHKHHSEYQPGEDWSDYAESQRGARSMTHNTSSTTAIVTKKSIFSEDEEFRGVTEDLIVCTYCEGCMDISEYRNNKEQCIFCNKTF